MGSVTSDVECKKCKFPYAHEDYNYRSGEVFIFCDRCGFHYSGHWKVRNSEYELDEEGNRIPITERDGGFGAYHQMPKRGVGQGGHFKSKWYARRVIKEMKKWLKTNKKWEGRLTVTKKIQGKWFFINLRTDVQTELPNNIDYLKWMDLYNGNG